MVENKFLKWMSSETKSVYWHDSAINSELENAMANGAVGMTTNPFLVNATLKAEPDFWRNAVAPSTVDTPFIHEQFEKPVTGPIFKAQRLGEVPLGRLATADDVANAVLYLASEEASFINGITLSVDGGTTCD